MKLIIKIIVLVIVISLTYSCCKEKLCADFTASEKEWMSYRNNDSLIFINEINDSIIILGAKNYREEQVNYHEPRTLYSCVDGCMNVIRINMYTIKSPFVSYFDFYIEKTQIDGESNSFFVRAGRFDAYDALDDTISNYNLFALKYSVHHDTITVLNKLLNDVYEYSTPNENNQFQKIYVKKGQGIIKFTLKNNEEYSLTNI